MNRIDHIRNIPSAFRVLRDEPMVMEFEFDFCFTSIAGVEGECEAVVFVSCPLANGDIMLHGCEIRIQDRESGVVLEPPAGWAEDKTGERLARIIDDLVATNEIAEEQNEVLKEDPQIAIDRQRLDALANEVAEIIMKNKGRGVDFRFLLSLYGRFESATIGRMYEIDKQHA